jgi:predicted phosphodiesterase
LSAPGRNCPLSYRYRPEVFARDAELGADTVWIAGGLYGNPFALERLLALYERERGAKALVFNGDFHWFDADPETFSHIDATVSKFHGLRGNIETELAAPLPDVGCGCAYPEWVDDGTVERSNEIIERLRAAASDARALAALPMHLVARVGAARVGVVHGDAESLAGWGFSQEVLSDPHGRLAAQRAFDQAQVDVFASSHTCLPVLQRLGEACAIVNNGAAGMPNFRGERFGIATRISLSESGNAIYAMKIAGVFVEAVPLRYDHEAWEEHFLDLWPPGSPAHRSYYERITAGPPYAMEQALREAGKAYARELG